MVTAADPSAVTSDQINSTIVGVEVGPKARRHGAQAGGRGDVFNEWCVCEDGKGWMDGGSALGGGRGGLCMYARWGWSLGTMLD